MVENGGNASKAMRDAGYSPATAENPSKLTTSKGFYQVCDDLGLTEELLVKALVADIKSKAGKRDKELALGFKVRGLMKDEVKHTGPDGGPVVFDIMGNASSASSSTDSTTPQS